jgi:hypothetical protein
MDDERLRLLMSPGSFTLNLNGYNLCLPFAWVYSLLHLLFELQKGVGAVTSSHYALIYICL